MNFDDLRKSWQRETTKNIDVRKDLIALGRDRLPLDRIRRNARIDIIVQILALLFIGFVPVFSRSVSSSWLEFYYLFYAVLLIVSSYYLINMARFYKRSNRFEMNGKDSLYETYYEVRLYVQMYQSFSFSAIPFILVYGVILAYPEGIATGVNASKIIEVVAFVGLCALMAFPLIQFGIGRIYGIHLMKIKQRLDQFREE